MTYKVIQPPAAPLALRESMIKLSTGETVAVKVASRRTLGQNGLAAGDGLCIRADARQIGAKTGNTIEDANGVPVSSSAVHSFDAAALKTYQMNALLKEMLLLVLGEPLELFGVKGKIPPLASALIKSVSITSSIALAEKVSGDPDPGSLL